MADNQPAQEAPTLSQVEIENEVEVAAERRMVHQVVLGAVVAVPIGVVVCVGLVFVATRAAGVPEGGPELMAVFVGVLFGVFFGALSGFVRNSAALDAIDVHVAPPAAPKPGA
jgi:hypothetical protein